MGCLLPFLLSPAHDIIDESDHSIPQLMGRNKGVAQTSRDATSVARPTLYLINDAGLANRRENGFTEPLDLI